MKVLKDIPNEDGFEFIGIDLNDKEIPCEVRKSQTGIYVVYNLGTPCFHRLKYWKASTPPQPDQTPADHS